MAQADKKSSSRGVVQSISRLLESPFAVFTNLVERAAASRRRADDQENASSSSWVVVPSPDMSRKIDFPQPEPSPDKREPLGRVDPPRRISTHAPGVESSKMDSRIADLAKRIHKEYSRRSRFADEFKSSDDEAYFKRNEIMSTVTSFAYTIEQLSNSPVIQRMSDGTESEHGTVKAYLQQLSRAITIIETGVSELQQFESSARRSRHELNVTDGKVKEMVRELVSFVPAAELESLSDLGNTRDAHTTGDIPPLLARLFDRQGDVGVLEQTLDDLFSERREEESLRQSRQDQELSVEPASDDEFNLHFDTRQKDLETQIREAKADVRELEEACHQAGWDIKAYERNPSNAGSESEDGEDGRDDDAPTTRLASHPRITVVSKGHENISGPTLVGSLSNGHPKSAVDNDKEVEDWIVNTQPADESPNREGNAPNEGVT